MSINIKDFLNMSLRQIKTDPAARGAYMDGFIIGRRRYRLMNDLITENDFYYYESESYKYNYNLEEVEK